MTKPKTPAKSPAKPRGKGKPLFTPKPEQAPAQPVADLDGGPDASQPLSNARHERFCWNVAMHGMTQSQAYILAGYDSGDEKTAAAHAARLVANGSNIKPRLTFLRAQAAALAIDVAALTKADVLNMLVEQHQRNMGVRPVRISTMIKSGKDAGKWVTDERYVYNEHAASQTLKMLQDEYGLGEGASGNKGDQALDISARAGLKDPKIADDLERLGRARRLAIAGGTDIETSKGKKTA